MEILSEGDSINELMILVGGMCEVLKPGLEENSEELSIDIDGHNSIRGGYARCPPYSSRYPQVRDAMQAQLHRPQQHPGQLFRVPVHIAFTAERSNAR